VGDDLAGALERRSLRARQAGIATGAALAAVLAQHASPDIHLIAAGAAAAVVAFAIALAGAQRDVRERSIGAAALASPRRVRAAARSLERLARLAESGRAEPRQTRPPCWVLELAPEADAIRELAALLLAHPEPPLGALAACDRFVFHCWNARLRGLDHELLRRELGRVRFVISQA
jgi:hypothetical protein